MAHQNRIINKAHTETPITTRAFEPYLEGKNSASGRMNFLGLPLINLDSPAEFVKSLDGRRRLGLVYSQCRNLADKRSHPSSFYVEFPAESGRFEEINANTLVASIGDSGARAPFSRAEIARVLEHVRGDTDFIKLLHTCRPS